MTPAEVLAAAVEEYLAEVDSPAPDLLYRRACRERMREALAKYQTAGEPE